MYSFTRRADKEISLVEKNKKHDIKKWYHSLSVKTKNVCRISTDILIWTLLILVIGSAVRGRPRIKVSSVPSVQGLCLTVSCSTRRQPSATTGGSAGSRRQRGSALAAAWRRKQGKARKARQQYNIRYAFQGCRLSKRRTRLQGWQCAEPLHDPEQVSQGSQTVKSYN